MRKSEIKKAKDNELVAEYAVVYSMYCTNINTGGGTKQLSARLIALEEEMLKRGLLTQEDIERLMR